MNNEIRITPRHGVVILCCALLGACASSGTPPPEPEVALPECSAQLSYYSTLSRMSSTEFLRERSALAALPQTPEVQLRAAMIYCHPRAPLDAGKVSNLLDGILKGGTPEAQALQPLARLLAEQCQERHRLEQEKLRLEGAYERQASQLREVQKRGVELQEKIDGLADIERSLPERARLGKPALKGTK